MLAMLAGFSGTASAATYVSTVLADNPVGYYRLGEANAAGGAVDSSTTGSNGTYNNFAGTAFGQTGIPGAGSNTAVRFDGSNDWINTMNTSIGGNDQTYTLEAWINLGTGALSSTGYAISHLRDNQNNRYHALGVNTAGNAVFNQNQNGAVNASASPALTLNDGNWHHLVGVFGSGDAADEDMFYVDGDLVASSNGPDEDGATDRVYLGLLHNRSGGTGWFDGLIDEAAFYQGALSEERITAHYVAGITPIPEPSSLGLLALGTILGFRRRRTRV